MDALIDKIAHLDHACLLAVKAISLLPGGAALSSIADTLLPTQETSFDQWQAIRSYAKEMILDMLAQYDSIQLSN
jgi:hypothetical protein